MTHDPDSNISASMFQQTMFGNHEWLPIATAPDCERVLLCGWQPQSDSCAAYWWWGEGMLINGVDEDLPKASHRAMIILPANFPTPPST